MAAEPDALATGFRDPPAAARPRVWWHWLNGNITRDGVDKDLAWMKRVGIGGAQAFDANRKTPQIVDKRLDYMSPEWKAVFRTAAERADALGLELGIASSPGWSETGGPWVKPEQAMKKLVWSELQVSGGRRLRVRLPPLPAVTGPYQSLHAEAVGHQIVDGFARDAAVVAYRTEAAKLARPAAAAANGVAVDVAPLQDEQFDAGVLLPPARPEGPGAIEISYAAPQTIRSAVVFVTDLPSSAIAGPLRPQLEASDDGKTWRKIAEIGLSAAPSTASFAPVTAKRFRLVFARGRATNRSLTPAPGADPTAAMGMGGVRPRPPQLAEFRLLPQARINAFEQKAGFTLVENYYGLDDHVGSDVKGLAPGEVVDLTGRVGADGMLEWIPPPGRWTVLRLGYSLTGKTNAPASPEATGLEVDKYDAEAVTDYLETYFAGYREATGDALFGARGVRALVMDSIEVGPSNWTPRMLEQFQTLRGYDARPWLPALTGTIVGSRAQSDAFLYDFRRTLGELNATAHYGTVAKVAHRYGLTVYGESLEAARVDASLGDDIEMRRFADVPMGAMWAYGRTGPWSGYLADMRGAASTAHIYGRSHVAAESLTSILTPWAYAPGDLQPMIDMEFLSGVNLPVIHTAVHQPRDDRQPGLTLGVFGQQFGRHETWAEMAGGWIDYIARNSYLLQQGRNVADVGYVYGEEAPIGVIGRDAYPKDVPKRYAYDFVPPDAVINELSVDGSEIFSKGGARYRVLYLGGTSARVTLPVLRKLAAFAEAGGVIVGEAPQTTPSLKDDTGEFSALVRRLWAGGPVTAVGKGKVFAGKDVEAALAAVGARPDFSYAAQTPDADVQFVHRNLSDGDLYFVSNRKARAEQLEARFRVTGKAPQIWRADTGAVAPLSYRIEGEETVVPLEMLAGESFFVVFREPASQPTRTVSRLVPIAAAEVTGPWKVAFQPGRGAPAEIELARLGSLSEQAEPGIKYFSGVATYTTSFTLPKGVRTGAPLWLDLGQVGDVAEVQVNGKPAGNLWKAPYRVDVGRLVRPGRNRLEVKVANLWVNRLIGDQQPGAQKITFTSDKTYTAKAPLRPSGLIGPVRLMTPAAQAAKR
ncbi:glycosyl hydrolase [Phenylobacterium sp. LjRoot225]|uniref:glycosyl hydrolase n=1 Tax=Phenylobacterium sp. LjRoot225 TaxID=3342285 RepID=UPI003ECEA003